MKKLLLVLLCWIFVWDVCYGKPGREMAAPQPEVKVAVDLAEAEFSKLVKDPEMQYIGFEKFILRSTEWVSEVRILENGADQVTWFWEASFVQRENSEFKVKIRIFPDKTARVVEKRY